MVALLEAVLRRPGLSPAEREYTLTALMKLSARLSGVADKVQVIGGRMFCDTFRCSGRSC